ncbi:hypothetical protein LCGC14_2447630, partial [marine sediment metagenome]
VTVIEDVNEKAPFALKQFGFGKIERKPLAFGDYTIKGLEKILIVERKSLEDLVLSITKTRKTMDKRVLAMRSFRYAFFVGEFSMTDIVEHCYRGATTEQSIIGTLAKYQSMGVSILNADNGYVASRVCARLLFFVACEVYNYAKLFPIK